MADNKNNNGKKLTGSFDDVLFSPSSDENDIASNVAKADKQAQTSFIADEAFGDVLFDEPSANNNSADAESEPPVVKTPAKTPAAKKTIAAKQSQPQEQVEEALFSSAEAFEQATQLPEETKATEQEQADDIVSEALFASEDELDKALSDDNVDEAEPEPDLTEALFDSDDDLDKALDTPKQQKPKPEKVNLSIAEAEAQKRQQEQKHIRDLLFTEAMQNNSISINDNNPQTVSLAKATINDLAALPKPETTIDHQGFAAFLQQQKADEQTAQNVEQDIDLKQKAKRFLFKARENFSEKVGADLVERTMSLNFAMLPQKPKSEIKDLQSITAMKVALTREGANIHTNTLKITQQLYALSQCQLSDADRLQMLDLLTPFIFDITEALEKYFYKKPYHPANKDYYLTGGRSVQMLQLAISGFKQVFASIYEANNFNYKRQEKTYQSVSNRLFGLLFVRQKLLFLFNQSHDSADVKLINSIFMAWSLYEREAVKTKQDIAGFGQGSFEQCFIHYHLLLAFDGTMLSKRLHQAFLLHLKQQVSSLSIFDHQVLQFAQGVSCLLLQEDRARFSYSVIDGATTISNVQAVIDIHQLLRTVGQNIEQCQKLLVDQSTVLSDAVLSKLPAADAISLCLFEQAQLLNLLANKIKPKFTQYQASDIDIVLGLEKSQAYLLGKKSIKLKNKPIPLVCQCKWQQLTSSNTVYLKTKNAANLPWFDVGQVVLMLEDIEGESEHKDQMQPVNQEVEKPKQKSLLLIESLTVESDQLVLALKHLADALLPVDSDVLGACLLANTDQGSALISAAKWPLQSNQVYSVQVFTEQALLQTYSLHSLTRQLQVQLIR